MLCPDLAKTMKPAGVNVSKRTLNSFAIGLCCVLSMWSAIPARAAAMKTIDFSLTSLEADGTCDFSVSFVWSGYNGGGNNSLELSLHSRYTDTSGTHDITFGTKVFSPVSGHDGSETWPFATFSGPGGPVPVIANGDWYGRAVLSSKLNRQGSTRVIADVASQVITRACRAG